MKKHLIIITLSLLALFTSLQQRVLIQDKAGLVEVSCGLPMAFITTDQSWRNPPYPFEIKCLGGEWGDAVDIKWRIFFIDMIIVYLSIWMVWSICLPSISVRKRL